MTSKEKANDLVSKYNGYVNPYIGSGMLSNDYDDRAILMQSKSCAYVTVDEMIQMLDDWRMDEETIQWWEEVRKEIDLL